MKQPGFDSSAPLPGSRGNNYPLGHGSITDGSG
jgi:hypothetical protein